MKYLLSKIALSTLVAAVGTLMSDRDFRLARREGRLDPAPRRWRNPFRSVLSSNKHRPHQGAREMARRRGGMDWDRFKAADRIRRGLPVSWPFQGMEG